MLLKLDHFFYMGGFALYVWLAYGCALIIVASNIVRCSTHKRSLKKRLFNYWRKQNESSS